MAEALMKPASHPGGLRLLVVEDEVMISALIEDMLTELGHSIVGLAASVDEAAGLAAGAEFDVALLDVNLQGETVESVAATLARRGKSGKANAPLSLFFKARDTPASLFPFPHKGKRFRTSARGF